MIVLCYQKLMRDVMNYHNIYHLHHLSICFVDALVPNKKKTVTPFKTYPTHPCSNRSLPNPTLDRSSAPNSPRPKAPGLSTSTGEPSWDLSGTTGPRLDFFLETKNIPWSKNVTSVCLEKNQRLKGIYSIQVFILIFFEIHP